MNKLGLSAHEKPPEGLSSLFKRCRALSRQDLEKEPLILDFRNGPLTQKSHLFSSVRQIPLNELYASFSALGNFPLDQSRLESIEVFELRSMPGLHFVPGLLPPSVQWQLVSSLLHRDLANHQHQTNISLHYKLPYHLSCTSECSRTLGTADDSTKGMQTSSFFNCKPDSREVLQPLNSETHKPISIFKFLSRKLRWITLGGQYDWTKKRYPTEQPPPFPKDIASFVRHCFPEMMPEAAIVNIYTPGDTLSLHRDVSEKSDKGLVSISLGCDAIFIAGLDLDGEGVTKSVALRLHSGDALYMSGTSRYLWHGVPQIISDTCPTELSAWPAESHGSDNRMPQFADWQGWMATKRVNLNIRQMRD